MEPSNTWQQLKKCTAFRIIITLPRVITAASMSCLSPTFTNVARQLPWELNITRTVVCSMKELRSLEEMYTVSRIHNQLQPQASKVYTLNYHIIRERARRRRVKGGRSGARQQAESLSHGHLTKSHQSPFSCWQKKNRSDGQAEQNEVKVILFKRIDRYSHPVCMYTCVWAFYLACQSARKWSCSDMTAGQVSPLSDVGVLECACKHVRVHANAYVCADTIPGWEGTRVWGVEKFRWPHIWGISHVIQLFTVWSCLNS